MVSHLLHGLEPPIDRPFDDLMALLAAAESSASSDGAAEDWSDERRNRER
jgi:hypothetical protein